MKWESRRTSQKAEEQSVCLVHCVAARRAWWGVGVHRHSGVNLGRPCRPVLGLGVQPARVLAEH